jgi:hypothetical protein
LPGAVKCAKLSEAILLLAYLIGLISVCTGLLLVATAVTIKNYWLLRELLEGAAPGRHDSGVTRERRVERYDSADPVVPDRPDTIEWTGPVTPYTPAGRET